VKVCRVHCVLHALARLIVNRNGHQQSLNAIRDEALHVLQALVPPQGEGDPVHPGRVIEHLRLLVPAGAQQAWLEAERRIWEPWLRQQPGFIGRELLWDSQRQQGVLFIHWASRQQWKAAAPSEVIAVQAEFESVAKQLLGLSADRENPFPLVVEGELSLP
jgi:uncharacterized protein (TIGR03792 family)